jgi:hypothetical protein
MRNDKIYCLNEKIEIKIEIINELEMCKLLMKKKKKKSNKHVFIDFSG